LGFLDLRNNRRVMIKLSLAALLFGASAISRIRRLALRDRAPLGDEAFVIVDGWVLRRSDLLGPGS
jgi:hypothetical protein